MTRAVLDVNVLVAAVQPRGPPAECLRAHAEGRFELIVSPALLSELRSVLVRPKLRPFVTAEQAERLVDALARDASIAADPPEPERVSSDPGDDYLVALARTASAHVLVSGDADLLELDLPDLPIVSPARFLDALTDEVPGLAAACARTGEHEPRGRTRGRSRRDDRRRQP